MAEQERYTVDELASVTGLTVRTTRYYAGLGLLPPPERRGRLASYTAEHRARLDLIRALQQHGFTLSAIETYLRRLPDDAGVEDLALQRAMLASWGGEAGEPLDRAALEARAGHPLDDDELDRLERIYAVRREGDGWRPLPGLGVALELRQLDISTDSVEEASAAINRHMEALADELTAIMRDRVVRPFRDRAHSEADTLAFEQTVARLRQLTLGAVVAGFQRAADEVIGRSLSRTGRERPDAS